MYSLPALCLKKVEFGIRSPRNAVTDDFYKPCCCLGYNLGPLQKHPVLLISEPSLQSQYLYFKKRKYKLFTKESRKLEMKDKKLGKEENNRK